MSEVKLPWLNDDEVKHKSHELISGAKYAASELLLSGVSKSKQLWDTDPLITLELGTSITWDSMPLSTARTVVSRLNKRYAPKRWRAVKHESGSVEIGRVE